MTKCPECGVDIVAALKQSAELQSEIDRLTTCDVNLNALINSERLKAIAQEDSDWGFSHEQADETMAKMLDKTAVLFTLARVFGKDIRDNYDHDADAHKHGTSCRVCGAKLFLKALDAMDGK
jgi:hypothetical protein